MHVSPEDAQKALAGIDQNDVGRAFDMEEMQMIRRLQAQASANTRPGGFSRHRRHPRGDRRKNDKGELIGPAWRQEVVFKGDSAEVDPEQTRFAIASAYLRRRQITGGSFSSFKKLSKAARLLNRA